MKNISDITAISSKTSKFRDDLAGLRGVAIFLVAVFHIWFGRVSGGVDVFLTLSGYFFIWNISKNIIYKSSWKDLNPFPQFFRLVKRLLPALTLVLIFIYIGATFNEIYPKTQKENIGSQILASLGYVQNWYLALNSNDYLAADAIRSPMQHIWSMSVQGQFFLIALFGFTFIGIVLKLFAPHLKSDTTRKILLTIVITITLASFIYATIRNRSNFSWTYYDTFARSWEPLLGGIFGLIAWKKSPPKILRTFLATVGLGIIIGCGFIIKNGAAVYPGPAALIPVGATLVIIISIHRDPITKQYFNKKDDVTLINKLLESKLLIKLGEISYSLYLWHWPILIYYLSVRSRDKVSLHGGIFILIISTIIAWVVSKFIEQPLRNHKSLKSKKYFNLNSSKYKIIITFLLIIGISSTFVSIKKWSNYINSKTPTFNATQLPSAIYPGVEALLHDWRVPKATLIPPIETAATIYPPPTQDHCISGFNEATLKICNHYGDINAKRTILVVGSSHSEHWVTVLDKIGKERHFRLMVMVKMGCIIQDKSNPTKLDGSPYTDCLVWRAAVKEKILELRPDYIFTVSTRPSFGNGDVFPEYFVKTFQWFKDNNLKVIAIRDTPWPHRNGKEIITPNCLARIGLNSSECNSPRKEVLSEKNPYEEYINSHNNPFPNIRSIDMTDGLCDTNTCFAIIGNIMVYHDMHHLSREIVLSMQLFFDQKLAKATNWWTPTQIN